MKYAFFQGCNIPIRIQQYADSTTSLLNHFGIELVVVPDFNCCGYPARNVDEKAYLLPSVRNMAIAERMGLDILVVCNCCFASLQKAKAVLASDASLRSEFNEILAGEGLEYKGTTTIHHYLTVLSQEIGAETLQKNLTCMFSDLKVAVIHGCHVLRPREVTLFDNSFAPALTDSLLKPTGAENIDWRGSLECCGAALAGINNELSRKLLAEKINGAKEAGADFIVPICSYCHLQFDTTQLNMVADGEVGDLLPVLLLPQLLGLVLGLPEEQLGLSQNSTLDSSTISALLDRRGPVVEKKKRKRKKKAVATS